MIKPNRAKKRNLPKNEKSIPEYMPTNAVINVAIAVKLVTFRPRFSSAAISDSPINPPVVKENKNIRMKLKGNQGFAKQKCNKYNYVKYEYWEQNKRIQRKK